MYWNTYTYVCASGKAIRRYVCSGVRWIEGEGLWGDRIRDNYTHAFTNTYTLPHTYTYIYILLYVIFYLYINCISYVYIHIILRKRDIRGPSLALSRLTSYKLHPHVFLAYLSITHCVYINELLVYVYVLQAQTSYR